MNRVKYLISNFFNEGHVRTIEAKRNILFLFAVKGISIIINLALVPITINYVNPTQYGIWLTLSSIVAWFSFFDIGFGNGLRNRFAEAIASGKIEKAHIYISTTYAILTLIFSAVWILFFVGNIFVDWSKILNTSSDMLTELSTLAIIVFTFFCLQIVLKTINTIIIADQKPAKAAFFDMLGQLLSLLIIFILTKTTNGSLIYLGLGLGFSPIFILAVSSIYFYSRDYKIYKPSLKLVKLSYGKDIFNLGLKFFFIQIAVIIIYQTNNVIIAQIGSPKDVTIFNIAYKYLSIALMLFSIIVSPFWSAFTNAYTNKDFIWMKKTVDILRYISYVLIAFLVILVLLSNKMYKLWIGDVVEISFLITIFVSIYIALLIIIALNTQILNGIGKLRIQLITYSFGTFFHIPLALYLGKIYGIVGVLMSAILFYMVVSIFSIRQVNLLVRNKATGIWNK